MLNLCVFDIFQASTELREPQKIEKIGETYLPYSVFLEYINGLGTSNFAYVLHFYKAFAWVYEEKWHDDILFIVLMIQRVIYVLPL